MTPLSNARKGVDVFRSVSANLYEPARTAAQRGQKVAGYMCTYTPVELLDAAGYVPVRILGRMGSVSRADSHLQVFACSLARSALDMALSGELDFLSLMVFSHTCDTMQNLVDIWAANISDAPVFAISTPVEVDTSHAHDFYRQELVRMQRFLEAERGSAITDEELTASIRGYDEHRAMMRRLYAVRRANPERLSGRDMLSVVLSWFVMPREEHARILERLVDDVESAQQTLTDGRPRVYVVGSICSSPDYVRAIEDAGCVIADDDLCTGSRAFLVEAPPDADPLGRLARMYLSRSPCPAKHYPGYDPGTYILEQARESQAEGVIFLLTKFCDPWAFDYTYVRERLRKEGMPSILLEIEQHVPPSEQFRTRVSAFAEMLSAGRDNARNDHGGG
jgi:bcr-type benzoyl-CoA reductase subunit C